MDTTRTGIRRFHGDTLPCLTLNRKIPLPGVRIRGPLQLRGRCAADGQPLRLPQVVAERRNEAVRERVVDGVEWRHGAVERGEPTIVVPVQSVAVGAFVEDHICGQVVDTTAGTDDSLVVHSISKAEARRDEVIGLPLQTSARMLGRVDEVQSAFDRLTIHPDAKLRQHGVDLVGVKRSRTIIPFFVGTGELPPDACIHG